MHNFCHQYKQSHNMHVANTNIPIHYYGLWWSSSLWHALWHVLWFLAYAAGQLQIDSEILMLCSYGCS
ncbi:transmembrane protein, putative [Medicago truncatula]|uniref:Transmembrane protein, putative n=1 Tax=Medicago truncatula TaxID=3880 RepID=A0A072UZD9_MEDTR|nr:transmembrane protein, putative [Medicago truncatula]